MTQLRPCIALDGTQSETCRFQHLVGIDHLLPVNQTMMARQPERHWPSIRFPAVSAVQRYCILRKASSYPKFRSYPPPASAGDGVGRMIFPVIRSLM